MSFDDNYEFWQEFIAVFKEKRCIWDVNSKEYRNKHVKNAAYESLIEKCKVMFPRANKEFVLKKIASLRSSFRRQHRRIENAKKRGMSADEIPKVTLWYYDLLEFLLDHEEVQSAVLSPEDNIPDETETLFNESEASEVQSLASSYSPVISSTARKRRQTDTSWTKKRDELINTVLQAVQGHSHLPERQEFTFGKNIAQQLQETEVRQKIIAQKLISDVLFYAKLGQLNDFSAVNNNTNNMVHEYHSSESPAFEKSSTDCKYSS